MRPFARPSPAFLLPLAVLPPLAMVLPLALLLLPATPAAATPPAGRLAAELPAQEPKPSTAAREPSREAGALEIREQPPFQVGEVLSYSISYAFLDAGTLRMTVKGVETVGARSAYHLTFQTQTNQAISAIYSLKDVLESWMDVERMHSLRFVKQSVEKGKRRDKSFRLDQERGVRVNEETGEEQPMPRDAQDDVSIFYFLRTLPLKEGTRFTLNNLMDPDDNPMRVSVLGTESVRVPAGKFDCYVLQLDVHTDSGIFSQGGEVKVWMTRNARRVPVKLESKLAVGSFTASLTDQRPGNATGLAAGVLPAGR